MSDPDNFKEIEAFLKKTPEALEFLKSPKKRKILSYLCSKNIDRIDYLMENPWIDLETAINVSNSIMDISPDIPRDEMLNILCRDTAILTNAKSATCRTYDPIDNSMLAGGNYKWALERAEKIPYEDSIAGHVIKTGNHYCVPDISTELMYKETKKILSMGINSMLALPVLLTDYEGAEKKNVLIGTLQLYFDEKNKKFYPQQIKLIKTIVSRFSYVLAQKRKLELQKRSIIIQQSRKAIISILKQTQSLDQVLNFLVAKFAETTNVNRCSLFSIERAPDGKKFAMLIAAYPLTHSAHSYGITLPFDEHPAFREVCETAQSVVIEEARKDPRMKANYALYLREKIENVCFVPIKDEHDTVTNILVLDGDESKPIKKEDMFFCNSLIQDIEICIQTSIHSQQRHDFLNQMLSFAAIAKVYTNKLNSPDASSESLHMLYKKLYKSMLAVNDIISDRAPFVQKEQFNLNELIAERLEAFFFAPGITVKHNLSEEGVLISADRKKVGRIVGNLLDNAHKKLEELKKGILEVYSYAEDSYAVVSIANTGSLPLKAQEILSMSKPSQNNARETGLGLSVVKLFTLMHNGILEYESPTDRNRTVFRIKLPL